MSKKKQVGRFGVSNLPAGIYRINVNADGVTYKSGPDNIALGGDSSFYGKTFASSKLYESLQKNIQDVITRRVLSKNYFENKLRTRERCVPSSQRKACIANHIITLFNEYLDRAYVAHQLANPYCTPETFHREFQTKWRSAVKAACKPKTQDTKAFEYEQLPSWLATHIDKRRYNHQLDLLKKALASKPAKPRFDETRRYVTSDKVFGLFATELDKAVLNYLRNALAVKESPEPIALQSSVSRESLEQYAASTNPEVLFFRRDRINALRTLIKSTEKAEWKLANNDEEKRLCAEKILWRWDNTLINSNNYIVLDPANPQSLRGRSTSQPKPENTDSDVGEKIKESVKTLFNAKLSLFAPTNAKPVNQQPAPTGHTHWARLPVPENLGEVYAAQQKAEQLQNHTSISVK